MGVTEFFFDCNYNIFATLTGKNKIYFSHLKKYMYLCTEL